MNDDTPRGTLGLVFGGVDTEGHDGATAKLYDPSVVITQLKLETTMTTLLAIR
jgi:hypothetical protein